MNTRPPVATATATGSEAPRRPADFLQPLARRVDQRPMTGQPSAAADKEPRRLTVARGISLNGAIAGCQRLVVEGSVEATLDSCETLEVAEQGSFLGTAEVEQAEVRGRIEGDLTVRGRLVIRATGRVKGRIRYQDLHIEAGGKLHGQIETLEPEMEAEEDRPSAGTPIAEAPSAVAPAAGQSAPERPAIERVTAPGDVARFSFAPAPDAPAAAATPTEDDKGHAGNSGTVAHELGVFPGAAQPPAQQPLDLTEAADPAPRLPTLRPS